MEQVKELISYARSQGVIVLELDGLRFQFTPTAFDQPVAQATTKTEDDSPHGHFRPE